MMLLVVKLHDLTADEWLEGIIAVREVRECVWAGHVQFVRMVEYVAVKEEERKCARADI